MIWRWLKVATLGAALVLTGAPTLERMHLDTGRFGAGHLEITMDVQEAEARSRSSGGYSRPSGGVSRTPSFGSGSTSRSRTPSTSGGYARPSSPGGSSFNYGSQSSGDRSLSRQSGGDALGRYRAQQEQQRQPPVAAPAPTSPGYSPGYDYGGSRRSGGWGWGSGSGSTYGNRGYADRGFSGWSGSRGWSVPSYAYRSAPRFGIWDGLFLWFLLDNLTRPGYGDFFHHHQNDPGYQQWRTEADRLAADNADLRQKLAALDGKLAEEKDQPRDPEYLPPDTPREVAVADGTEADADAGSGFGEFGIVAVILVGGGVIFLIWLWNKQRGARPARSGEGNGSMSSLKTAGNILRQKLSGETYTPSLFRVGMTLTLDPTPFILAAGSTKVQEPTDVSAGGMLVSVAMVSTVSDGAATLHRLYLPEEKGFFQIHLNTAGQPDECRFFSLVDEVHPGSEDEWAFWLDPAEGMIGWPEFQTKDGKVYPRLWTPGASRVPPRTLYENGTDVKGMTVRTLSTMLYAAPTGAADPAPATEYVMVSAIEQGGQAWVEVRAGIDVNPAALSLA
ncbi:DUF2491 family protein [Skermanella aerolata]|uniref:DUF2491 family protein n=1 Tax=Skermanella aerolata TaxID=393310 RepID=UPI0005E270C8|nr:DUF2491 family protein [Skermanella aerolata]KJB91552.1 hypothetical protein N826_27510 [Skermanella aerolata KACC 11604]